MSAGECVGAGPRPGSGSYLDTVIGPVQATRRQRCLEARTRVGVTEFAASVVDPKHQVDGMPASVARLGPGLDARIRRPHSQIAPGVHVNISFTSS